MHSLTLFSPAKINLFLHITAQRADGYHLLQSVFRALNFGDTLHFHIHTDAAKGLDAQITLDGADHLTEHLADNLIIKAAHALKARFTDQALSTQISLEKHIPTGAGLGGGSSNCATTLIALNQLWQLNLSCDALCDIGVSLGADVPFFIFAYFHRTDAQAAGIGEVLTPLVMPPSRYLLLLPKAHIATAALFSHADLRKNFPIYQDITDSIDEYAHTLSPRFCNAFESIVSDLSPPVAAALAFLKSLETHTHTRARMSGTGSTVFLPLPSEIDEKTLQLWQKNAPCTSIIAENLY